MNFYEILHVSQTAPDEVIKLAYKALAQKYHPDRYKGDDANEIMIKIRKAYEVLIDPVQRKKHDQDIAEKLNEKQRIDDYFKKKQQEDFVKNQNKGFGGFEENKDSENFKINISISIKSGFYNNILIFIKRWFSNHKTAILGLFSSIVGLFILFFFAAYLVSIKSVDSSDSSIETSDAEVVSITDDEAYELNDEGLQVYADSVVPVSSPETELVTNSELDTSHNYVLPYFPSNSDELIKNASNAVLGVTKENGLIGLKEFIGSCYEKFSQETQYCLYFDIASKRYHDYGVQAGIPKHDFFDADISFERIIKNHYNLFSGTPESKDQNLQEALSMVNNYMDERALEYSRELSP